MTSQLILNGVTPIPGSQRSGLVDTKFSANLIVSLNVNDNIVLQLSGINATASLQSGTSATLTIIKLKSYSLIELHPLC